MQDWKTFPFIGNKPALLTISYWVEMFDLASDELSFFWNLFLLNCNEHSLIFVWQQAILQKSY